MPHSMEDIAAMTPEDFATNWYNGTIHEAVYTELGIKPQSTNDNDAIEL